MKLTVKCIVLIALAQSAAIAAHPEVTVPPDPFFEKVREKDRDPARRFYRKYIDVEGLPVAAAAELSDLALYRTCEIVTHMLAGRHDILKALIADGVRLVILGPDEKLSDLPKWEKMAAEGVDHTARYLDYSPEIKLLVVFQENVLDELAEPYATECQVVRVFAGALYHVTAKRPVDPKWEDRGRNVQQYELRVQRMDIRFDKKLKEFFDSAMSKGLWKGTVAVHNRLEYWIQGVLAYFDATGQGIPPNDTDRPITTRESLRNYDPGLFELVEETMAYKGKVDWRYQN